MLEMKGKSAEINKGLNSGSDFHLGESRPELTLYKGYVQPRLLTNVLAPSFIPTVSNVYTYDLGVSEAVLPTGKGTQDVGGNIAADTAQEQMFKIPSTGLQFSANMNDVHMRRMVGEDGVPRQMTIEDLANQKEVKGIKGYDLFNEYNIAKVLTADTMDNLDGGKFFTAPDYHVEIVGAPRPANIATNFASATLSEHRDKVEAEMDRIQEVLAIHGKTSTGFIMICGKDYFSGIRELEEQADVAREIKGLDLIQSGTPVLDDGMVSNQRFLEGSDGVTYMKYNASILAGQPLIDADKAYLVPTGVEDLFYVALAPTRQDKAFAGQEGRTMYSWETETRGGVIVELESNRLYGTQLPQATSRFQGTFA